jgi:fumarate reductase flavoprotein subunit
VSAGQSFDVVVMGGGIAGLVTAVRLAEKGVPVALLEKGDTDKYMCNTRMAGGAFHVAFRDVAEDPAVILDAIKTNTYGYARDDYATTLANGIGDAVKWLKTKGVRFIKVGHEVHRQHTLAPPIALTPGKYWEGRGGDVMIRALQGELRKLKGTLLTGTRVTRLKMADGRCVGVEAEQSGKSVDIAAKAVVICDGGFQGNLEMLKQYISPAPKGLKQRGAATAMGDGLRMAQEAGAQTTGMDCFYGHLLSKDALTNDNLWPFPIMDFPCTGGLVVNGAAQRFMDEGRGGVFMANSIAKLDDPLSSVAIFDEEIWDGPGRHFITPANPLIESWGGTVFRSPDLAGISKHFNLPLEKLEHTIAEYNAAVESGAFDKLAVPRTTSKYKPYPIRKAPFYAVPLCAGITYTMGGLVIDSESRVLGMNENPIPGLYAAGCVTGGLEGGALAGYVGGLTKGSVTGLRAADHIAANR